MHYMKCTTPSVGNKSVCFSPSIAHDCLAVYGGNMLHNDGVSSNQDV